MAFDNDAGDAIAGEMIFAESAPNDMPDKAAGSGSAAIPSAGASAPVTAMVAIIDRRVLGRESLTLAFASTGGRFTSQAFADIGEWQLSAHRHKTSLILLAAGSTTSDDPELLEEFRVASESQPNIPVVLIGDSEDPGHILEILACGARGYIPTSVSLNVAVGALCLAMAGGIFVPASALVNADREAPARQPPLHSMFGLSGRQAAVAEAVALGKPNKIIAYELNLCESTVKVHIRTIMKKLQARNRTEVAFKLHTARGNPRPFGGARQVGPLAT